MKSRIQGTVMPVLEVGLENGESVFSESGELGWISAAVQMRTGASVGGQQGGLFGALGRALTGGTLFMTEYTAVGGPGLAVFTTKLPGQILPLELDGSRGYLVHRHGFLAAQIGVQFSMGFQQSLGAGIFGGTGFRMQRLSGRGSAWVELNGEVITYDLEAGNSLRVHPGHVGMFEEGMNFQVSMVPGIQNALFGGSGLFLATLTGPGRVWLQSMTMSRLAHAIYEYLPQRDR